jgi:alkylation response protein AidB-like acyl-CoA dehydrogenase
MSDSDAFAAARRSLRDWRDRFPGNHYEDDGHLGLVNRRYLGWARLSQLHDVAGAFGHVVATDLGPLVDSYRKALPQLTKYDGHGDPIERIDFDGAYHEAGDLVWRSGLVRIAVDAGASFEQANLFYLASLEGEMGHMCAATCTTGLIRVLRRHADAATRDEYLPPLADANYATAWRGAQYLTEVQGGSDVGANVSTATMGPVPGEYKITGEKWFCSVVDADVFLLLARPMAAEEGTGGLACFVMPRMIDGKPNGFSIRRLKDKLGTTAMASGEVDFTDATAQLVGPEDAGFKIMVTAMLNTSRWMNALGDVGIMRRAYLEAVNYAAVRNAFGQRIGDFPLVRRQLAEIKAEWLAALHSTWELTALDEAVDVGAMGGPEPDVADAGFHRYLVNANKLGCSLAATDVVRGAIEILGGNGAIEEFSVLPRLLRDAVVYEQWEGTHNVLTAQVLRDLGRLGLGGTVIDRTATLLKGIADDELGQVAGRAQTALEDLAGTTQRCIEDSGFGALHFRNVLLRLLRAHQVALLLDSAASAGGKLGSELAGAATLLLGRYLDADYEASDDPGFLSTVDAVLGVDVD